MILTKYFEINIYVMCSNLITNLVKILIFKKYLFNYSWVLYVSFLKLLQIEICGFQHS